MRFAIRYNSPFRALATVLGMGPGQSGVEVEPDHIDVHMGWAFRARIPRTSVRQAEQVEKIPTLLGLGVHGWGGRWAANGTSAGGVRIEIDPAARARVLFVGVRLETLYLSLEQPEAFIVAAGRITPS